jgi:hypothetical protein
MNTTSAASVTGSETILGARDQRPWVETPLDTETNCIRILRLGKGSGDMPIICDLEVVSLDADPYYEVLSYVWGDPKETRPITVGGVAFNATVNLFDFMRCLRLPDQDRRIWADAICIDQLNEVEKSYQIGLMTKVYRLATEAHIWFGPFDIKTWYKDIAQDKDYIMAWELTPESWKKYERICDPMYFKSEAGFKPLSQAEHAEFVRRCRDDIFLEALNTLDKMAEDHHLYTYPVFSCNETNGDEPRYAVNQSWLWVMDVIRWLVIRPWWSRVWTLQEAVLPRVDPTIHAPPYSFKMSRLLNGIEAMLHHNGSACCKWFGQIVRTTDRTRKSEEQYTQTLAIVEQRQLLAANTEEGMGVPLEHVVGAIQGRKATKIWDHWFGIFGFLPSQWQEELKNFPAHCTTAELFSQCSKLVYSNSQDLTRLELARRTKPSQVSDMPSWAIDLSSQRSGNEEDYSRWILYDATSGTQHDPEIEWSNLKTPVLSVQAKRVATIQNCAERILPYSYIDEDVHRLVKEWLELYRSTALPVPEENAFWRAVFMDRNVQKDWMTKRYRLLGTPRLNDIKNWWRVWSRTNDRQDLTFDRKAVGTIRGQFHYKALQLNVQKTKFFVSSQGLPGMGPHDAQPGDEIYALKGCKALVVLRSMERNEVSVMTVVGLCFIDRWMYGRALQIRDKWEKLELY